MNKIIIVSVLLFTLVFSVQAKNEPSQIIVTGSGTVKAKADLAYVMIGVERTEKTATAAQEKVAEKMTNVLASLAKLGLAKDNLETTDLDLRPNYDYKSRQRILTGYTASNQIRATVAKLDQLGEIIDTAISAGATNIRGINFTVNDPKPFKKAALNQAVKAAKAKAEVIANAAGLVISKIERIQESGAQVIPAQRNLMAFKAETDSMATPVLPGKIEVRGNLTVVYNCALKK